MALSSKRSDEAIGGHAMVHQRCADGLGAQRAVVKNGDWNDFFTFLSNAERNRSIQLYTERIAPYQKAA